MGEDLSERGGAGVAQVLMVVVVAAGTALIRW